MKGFPQEKMFLIQRQRLSSSRKDSGLKQQRVITRQSQAHSPALFPGVLRNGHTDDRGNYHITADDQIGAGGKVAKFEANTEAIRILKLLEEQNATLHQMSSQGLCCIRAGVVYRKYLKKSRRASGLSDRGF